MRQAVSADEGPTWCKPAGLLDVRPKFADGAELSDGQELILIGGEAEEDEAARVVEREALLLERAEISEGIGEHKGKLLRLGAAGGMHGPSVRDGEGAGKALLGQTGDDGGHRGCELAPRLRDNAARRHGA